MRLSLYFEQVLSFSTSCSWLDSDPNVKCFLWFGAELCWVVSHHVEWNTAFTPKNTFSYKQWNKWMNETMLKVFYVLRQTQIVCNHQTKCIFLLVCEAETAKDPSDWLRTSNERVYSMWLHEVNVYSCLCVGILIVCGGFGPVKHLSNHKKPLKKRCWSAFLRLFTWLWLNFKKEQLDTGEKKETYTCTKARNAQPASQPAQYSPTSITEALAPFQSSVIQAGVNAHMWNEQRARVFLRNNQRMVMVLWVTIYPESSPIAVCAV